MQTSLPEWLGFCFALLQVYLAISQNKLNFYAGLISVSLYIWVFYHHGLYAESLLNLYYWIMSVWGIFHWGKPDPIGICHRKHHVYALVGFVVFVISLYLLLTNMTPSDVPLADATVSALAWIGTWLLVKRKIENWIWLSVSNLIAIPLLWYKDLELTALLTVIYLILGIRGYLTWRQIIRNTKKLHQAT